MRKGILSFGKKEKEKIKTTPAAGIGPDTVSGPLPEPRPLPFEEMPATEMEPRVPRRKSFEYLMEKKRQERESSGISEMLPPPQPYYPPSTVMMRRQTVPAPTPTAPSVDLTAFILQSENIEGWVDALKGTVDMMNRKITRVSREMTDLKMGSTKKDSEISKIQSDINRFSSSLESMDTDKFTRQLVDTSGDLSKVKSELNTLDFKSKEMEKVVLELKVLLGKIKSIENLVDISKNINRELDRMEKSRKQASDVSEKFDARRREFETLKTKIETNEENVSGLLVKVQDIRKSLNTLMTLKGNVLLDLGEKKFATKNEFGKQFEDIRKSHESEMSKVREEIEKVTSMKGNELLSIGEEKFARKDELENVDAKNTGLITKEIERLGKSLSKQITDYDDRIGKIREKIDKLVAVKGSTLLDIGEQKFVTKAEMESRIKRIEEVESGLNRDIEKERNRFTRQVNEELRKFESIRKKIEANTEDIGEDKEDLKRVKEEYEKKVMEFEKRMLKDLNELKKGYEGRVREIRKKLMETMGVMKKSYEDNAKVFEEKVREDLNEMRNGYEEKVRDIGTRIDRLTAVKGNALIRIGKKEFTTKDETREQGNLIGDIQKGLEKMAAMKGSTLVKIGKETFVTKDELEQSVRNVLDSVGEQDASNVKMIRKEVSKERDELKRMRNTYNEKVREFENRILEDLNNLKKGYEENVSGIKESLREDLQGMKSGYEEKVRDLGNRMNRVVAMKGNSLIRIGKQAFVTKEELRERMKALRDAEKMLRKDITEGKRTFAQRERFREYTKRSELDTLKREMDEVRKSHEKRLDELVSRLGRHITRGERTYAQKGRFWEYGRKAEIDRMAREVKEVNRKYDRDIQSLRDRLDKLIAVKGNTLMYMGEKKFLTKDEFKKYANSIVKTDDSIKKNVEDIRKELKKDIEELRVETKTVPLKIKLKELTK